MSSIKMPRKQKGKISSARDNAISSSPKPSSIDDPVCGCIELDLKPSAKRRASKDAIDKDIDNRYAVVHWSDAYKLDIRDGEPALVVSSPGLESSGNGSLLTSICKVRISPAEPSFSGSITSTKNGMPTPSKKNSIEAATCGEILLKPDSMYEHFSPVEAGGANKATTKSTPQSSAAIINNATYASPSKAKFSFSKGGGGDSLISPPPKLTSPSGSKFSFSKGGGGDSLLSPGQTRTPTPRSRSAKRSASKVLVMPLINLPLQRLRRLCPDAQKLVVCPANGSIKSPINSYVSSATNIIQTLIISKYKGAYVPLKSTVSSGLEQMATNSTLNESLETISISFRGQRETFCIVDAIPAPSQDGQTSQGGAEDQLSSMFDRIDISREAIDVHSNSVEGVKELQVHGKPMSVRGVACRITAQTKVDFISSLNEVQPPERQITPSPPAQENRQHVCAGLDATLSRIKDALLPPLLHPNLFPADGPLRPPKGALLFGPAGVGKSLLASQIANDLSFAPGHERVHVRLVQCADILSSNAIVGEAEKMLTDIFEQAGQKAVDSNGSLVILDDVHLICPRRGGMGGGGSGVDELAGTLLALLDGIGSTRTNIEHEKFGGGLVVLAVTTDPSLLDPALRRPGRLDVEVEVSVPDDHARADILGFHLSQVTTAHQFDESVLKELARLAKGFTGADCKLAVKEAVRIAISRTLKLDSMAEPNTTPAVIEYSDLEHAIRITKPSAIKSVSLEVPKVPWSAIGGMDNVKALLRESIELPLTHPHLFEMMRVPPPKGILLFGPPGCSKTLMARAIATEGNMNFLAVKGPELLSKWLGESERALASLFRRARLAAPAVIFFDEMDAIASKRGDNGGGGGDRLLSQLLTELDGVTSGGSVSPGGKGGRVVVVGATNRPDVLDAALTRPGRMDRMIYVGLPDEQGRKGIFEIGLSGKDCHRDVDSSALASDELSKGYSGAEIIALCRDAALHAIGEMDDGNIDRPQICMRHLLQSINDMKPRTTKEMLKFYESFRGRH